MSDLGKPQTDHGSRPKKRRKEPLVDVPHLAARLEDRFHAFRERRGRKRGLVPTIIPFTGYGSDGWIRVLARVVLMKPGRPREDRFTNVRGWRSFFSIPVRDVDVTVVAGNQTRLVQSDRGGVVDGRVEVRIDEGWNEISLAAAEADLVSARIFVVGAKVRRGLVSDIDDTVMVTALPRPFLAAWNTFVLDEHARRPVPGMSVFYERLLRSQPGAPVIYLSTGAWNVAPTLTRFLGRNLYPAGTLLLTDWGPTHDRWFRSGPAHQRAALRRLAEEFPQIDWVLVGDDGQHDEQLYDEFLTDHPENVAAVAIRQLTASEAVFAGGRSKASDHTDQHTPWVYAPDGAGLFDQLSEAGLIDPEPGAARS
jgi:phosphatidate phosphatase APP1